MTTSIKFIATDMDGTLLCDNKQLPSDFYEVFQLLQQKNILFSAASGRQYQSLVNTFEPVKDHMVFIAENGTLVMYKGKEIYSSTIPTDEIHTILKSVQQVPDCDIVLCGKNSAYTEATSERALNEIRKYYHNLELVDDLFSVDDEFIKIAVLNFNGTEEHIYPVLAPVFGETHQVVVSAKIWLDLMHKTASKGAAIKHLQKEFGFTFEESMSFGDFFNDAEMLKETYHSYSMENAHPEIKKLARFEAPSNNEQGVMTVIKQKIL
ncbi:MULTISPECIES: Cof-type HAD-IIB family hydrolase [unclassified Photobacterium]|uniref:Cof-type HAD-IIB family hydrolase n=1 Tax=unclassified Photobacterium TaxID=2628852 RepID=UPI001EDFC056|nr:MULTISPECIES: Cof-type HAD-IIB family hydrolase [unclassified Photobacterium]MCG3863725.1 HAD family hydrolase [Photobacterium sp. Ph6]MCG3875175.1 HAD family hydrolase [Photobacterium sp. Ph5]